MDTGYTRDNFKLLQEKSSNIMSFQNSINFRSPIIVCKNRKIGEHFVHAFKDNVQKIFAESGDLIEVGDNILFSDDVFERVNQINGVRDSARIAVGAMARGRLPDTRGRVPARAGAACSESISKTAAYSIVRQFNQMQPTPAE